MMEVSLFSLRMLKTFKPILLVKLSQTATVCISQFPPLWTILCIFYILNILSTQLIHGWGKERVRTNPS